MKKKLMLLSTAIVMGITNTQGMESIRQDIQHKLNTINVPLNQNLSLNQLSTYGTDNNDQNFSFLQLIATRKIEILTPGRGIKFFFDTHMQRLNTAYNLIQQQNQQNQNQQQQNALMNLIAQNGLLNNQNQQNQQALGNLFAQFLIQGGVMNNLNNLNLNLQNQNQQLNNQVINLNQNNQQLNNQILNLNQQIQGLHFENLQLRDRADDLTNRLNLSEGRLLEANENVRRAEQTLNRFQNEMHDKNQRITTLEENLNRALNKEGANQNENLELERQVSELLRSIEEATRQKTTAENRVRHQQIEINQLRQQQEELSRDWDLEKKDMLIILQGFDNYFNEINKMIVEYGNNQQEYAQKLDKLNIQFNNKKKLIKKLMKTFQNNSNVMRENLSERKKEMQIHLKELKEQIEDINDFLNVLQQKI